MLEVICLIPELSFMTGLSDEMRSDYKVMKVTIATSTVQLTSRRWSCNLLDRSRLNREFLTSPFFTISLCRAADILVSQYFQSMPCLQSVGISSCLPLCYPSISFSVDLCSFSQKLLSSLIDVNLNTCYT